WQDATPRGLSNPPATNGGVGAPAPAAGVGSRAPIAMNRIAANVNRVFVRTSSTSYSSPIGPPVTPLYATPGGQRAWYAIARIPSIRQKPNPVEPRCILPGGPPALR